MAAAGVNPEQVTYDLFAVSSGEGCKRLYQLREAQGGPSDGPGKLREVPREGHWEAQEECRQDPGRPREGTGKTHGPGRERGRGEVKRRRRGKGGGGGFEFPFPFGQKGREGGLRNPSLLLPSTWEEGVLNFPPPYGQKVEGGGLGWARNHISPWPYSAPPSECA